MPIAFACICPPEVDPAAARTLDAFATIRDVLRSAHPELAVIIMPQGPVPLRAMAVVAEQAPEFAERIREEARRDQVPIELARHWQPPSLLDHLAPALESALLLPLAVSSLATSFHVDLGRAVARTFANRKSGAVLICAATLAGTGETRTARLFDSHYQHAIEDWDVKWLSHLDTSFRHNAAEDCIAQTAVLMGALSASRIQPRVLSYEAPFGKGLLVAAIDVLGARRGRQRAE